MLDEVVRVYAATNLMHFWLDGPRPDYQTRMAPVAHKCELLFWLADMANESGALFGGRYGDFKGQNLERVQACKGFWSFIRKHVSSYSVTPLNLLEN